IDAWAAAAKQFGHPLFVSFAKEPNGSGFPWSGMYCGGDEKVAASGTDTGSGTFTGAIGKQGKLDLTLSVSSLSPTGGQYEGPETYKKAYRYVVDRVRAKGASNVIWVFQVMNFSIPQDDWNYIAQYYPGAGYVDWLALTISGAQYPDDAWSPFSPLLKEPYAEICKLDPSKPVMIAEWRCGEFPKSGSKADFIAEAFSTMKNYPRLKAAIYWDETWQNEDDSKSDLRVDSSPEALDAYKKGVADPFWIDHPIYRQTAK
ncbi:MAG TPA: glycosyl hydrolase, partial [Chthoniobacteraceae bacterium]|nr:glycosyl hydrolase [Chthoniobacteraceae bacterium]